MQTFLPYADFNKSLECLDRKRVFKQAVETRQIIDILTNNKKAWRNHPAIKMWENYTDALKVYYNINIDLLKQYGFKLVKMAEPYPVSGKCIMPKWFGYPPFHLMHRRNLVRKDPVYYGKFNVEPTEGYLWPITKDGNLLPEIVQWRYEAFCSVGSNT